MSKYRKLTHVYYKCDYHIVFTPKYRFRILEGMIKSLVEHDLQVISTWKDVQLFRFECTEGSYSYGLFNSPEAIRFRLYGNLKMKDGHKVI